jgi:peptidoglycan/LPS O-acetylase OafA/YrhL
MVLDSIFIGGMLGGLGVFMFFAISGFLIAYTIFQKTENKLYGFKNYFVDRFSRIYLGLVPALIISLLVAIGIYATNNVYFNHLSETESSLTIQSFSATLGMMDKIPSGFLTAVFSTVFSVPFSVSTISPFGFNDVLWTLAVEWWIYMFFGWLILGSLSLFRNNPLPRGNKVLFFAITILLSTMIVALAWDYIAFIMVWFMGASVMYAICNPTIQSKLSGRIATLVLISLFIIAIAAVGYQAYVIYSLTHESFNLIFGMLISVCIFLGVFIINCRSIPFISKILLKKQVVKSSTIIAGFSYTIFLIHYPILLFLNGLNLETDRMLLLIPVVLLINEVAFIIATLTEKNHKVLAVKIKNALNISQF